MLKINLHKMTYWKLLRRLLLIIVSVLFFFFFSAGAETESRTEKEKLNFCLMKAIEWPAARHSIYLGDLSSYWTSCL